MVKSIIICERIIMTEQLGGSNETQFADNDAWSVRWRELNATLPHQDPTPEEIDTAAARLQVRADYLVANPEEKDDLDAISEEVLGDPTALAAYASVGARYSRIERQLADEGLFPPVVED
jgi:FAD/FMN-containing dehydrogenase